MKQFNLIEFTKFIPTHVLATDICDDNIGEWIPVNRTGTNWLNEPWKELVYSISLIAPGIIIVLFNSTVTDTYSDIERHHTAIYKGELY